MALFVLRPSRFGRLYLYAGRLAGEYTERRAGGKINVLVFFKVTHTHGCLCGVLKYSLKAGTTEYIYLYFYKRQINPFPKTS